MDRRLGLREQVSAAWTIASMPTTTTLEASLIRETAQMLPHVRMQIIKHGWNLRADLHAAIIVLILFLMILITTLTQINQQAEIAPLLLPSFAGDPSAAEVFPSGLPGLGRTDDDADPAGNENSSDALGNIGSSLAELGEALATESTTFELGQALQQGELDLAAEQLEVLADQLDQLAEQTQQSIANAFADAADQMEPQSDMQNGLETAADALQSGDEARAGEALDELAGELRALDQQLAQAGAGNSQGENQQGGSGVGAGGSQTGQIEPLVRVEGQGQIVEFDIAPTEDGVLAPASSEENPGQVINGQIGPAAVYDATLLTGTLDPYTLPFALRDVVATYFTPR